MKILSRWFDRRTHTRYKVYPVIFRSQCMLPLKVASVRTSGGDYGGRGWRPVDLALTGNGRALMDAEGRHSGRARNYYMELSE